MTIESGQSEVVLYIFLIWDSLRPEGAFAVKGILASIAQLFEREQQLPGALGRLSEDPVALAEILLLFRMVLADGIVQPSQLTAFERICEQNFGVNRRDMPDLHALLDSPKARSCDAKAFSLLGQLDTEARTTLLEDMMQIARAGTVRNDGDERLIRRTADLLGLKLEADVIEGKGTFHG